ncbi:MAG: Protease [Bacteroidetes bacterium]|nr:MAG: Protease [Bacteroidota bacterium]
MRFLYLFLAVSLISPTMAQQTYKVKRGERPVINLESVPESAYYKGVIKIKLNDSYTRQMDENPARIDADGIVRLGIPDIDNLNAQFGVNNFGLPFNSPSFSGKFTERHRAWGFHLWYKLYFDESVDVKALIRAYSALPDVMIAEPEYRKELVNQDKPILYLPEADSERAVSWTPDDPRYNEQWHYDNTGQQNGTPDADIDLPEAWEITKGNPEVIVSIEDGGINYTHGDIAANMWSGIGYNFVNNTPNVSSHDHGTHVAGTVAAVSNNAVGVAGVAGGGGTGDGVRLMSCQVFTNGGSGGFENAPVWAADNGAAISQNSWQYTSPGNYDQAVLDAIDYFNVNGGGEALVDGGLTIFAAGNNDSQSQYYPAYYSGTFSVAGLTNQDKKAWYSNYGDWVEVAAPGGETDNVNARGVLSTLPNNTYGFYQGTSMACPHVSGLAALIVSLAYGQFTPQQVADIIKNTTDNVDAVNPGFEGQLGSGRINAFAALTEAQELMINVDNPLAFSALAGSNVQINLNWVKNQDNDDVMVAYSPDNVFGDPVQTQTYQVGDVIEGGGTLIYKGTESAFIHTGLTSNTPYYYKAWSLNGVPEYSQGLTTSATTLKEPITVFPYHQGFDEESFPPANWDNKQLSGTGMWDWQTTGTNPDCLPHTGEGMARYNSNLFASGTSGILVTPPVQFMNDDYETSIWVYRDGNLPTSTDRIEIYANIAPNTGFASLLGTIHRSRELAPVESADGWYQYSFDIPASFHNKLTYLVYKGISDQGNNLFADDISIEIPVTCFPPVDLSIGEILSSSATVSWTGVAPAAAWDLEYGVTGFEPGTGTLLSGLTNPVSDLEGLDQNTAYEVYVRGACATDELSTWAGPAGFTTLCNASTPWEETFEAAGSSIECWQIMKNTAEDGGLNGNNLLPAETGSWIVCTPESFEGLGNQYIYEGMRSAAIAADASGLNWLITAELQMPETVKTDLSFRVYYTSEEAVITKFYVNLFTSGTWQTLLSYNDLSAGTNHFAEPVMVNLDAFQGQTIRLAFVYEQNNGNILSVDNINLTTASNYWTGNAGTAWNNEGNWRIGVPQSGDEINIYAAANNPRIDGNFETTGNLTIHTGATLTLAPDTKITLNGELINHAGPDGLLLMNSGSSSASLIHYSENVEATVQHFGDVVSGFHQWRLLSAPVNGQAITPDFIGVPQVPGDVLLKYDEPTATWIDSRLENGDWNPAFESVFSPGRAYHSAFASAGLRPFRGTLSSGNVETESITNSGEAGGGWHLVGNPYTSSYQWNPGYTFLSYIAKVWNDQGSCYTDLFPGSIIPAMTGFWIQNLAEVPAGFSLDPQLRTHEPSNNTGPGEGTIQLMVTENVNSTFQGTCIRKNAEATTGFDQLLDAHFLPGFAPQLYSVAENEKLSTNSLSDITSGNVIQLGFVKNTAADYTLQVIIPAQYPDMVAFINDKKTGELFTVSVDPTIHFTSAPGDDPNRFELIFGTVGTENRDFNSDLTCYSDGSSIILLSSELIKGEIRVSSLSGQQLIAVKAPGEHRISIDAGQLAPGTYLVSLDTGNGWQTRKVFVSK